jgi:hypothetical protein
LLVLAGIGWALYFVGLAAAFQVLPYGPQLFLVGCIVGAIIQYVADAARRRMSVGEEAAKRPTRLSFASVAEVNPP